MNTQQITEALADYDVTTRTDSCDVPHVSARNGSRLAQITPDDRGEFRASAWMEYGGADARNFCDARTYKTERGAVKFARNFLR